MPARRGVGLVLLLVVVGLVIGSLFGELLAWVVPGGSIHDMLTRGPTIGLTSPLTLDLRFLSLTFGFSLKVNVVGVLGVIVAALILRRL
jgi:hypothetical protein